MMSLKSPGLTAEQERLYRYLLRHPHADLKAAGVELVMPGVRPVLAELRALGLVSGTLTALPPAAAVDVLVRRRIEQGHRTARRTPPPAEERPPPTDAQVRAMSDGSGSFRSQVSGICGSSSFQYAAPARSLKRQYVPLQTRPNSSCLCI
ncbi:hypothetical protein ABZW11_30050 [Nonomuraea sp. NPDC004580]|uniref:hypothetical protein n=1 Tax=Nonomuraea sp. NPDC004580 TaxID=3154552 RepID=UPI0033A4C69E